MNEKKDNIFNKIFAKAKENIPHTIAIVVTVIVGLALAVYLLLYFQEMKRVQSSVNDLKALKEEIIKNSELTPQPAIVTLTPVPENKDIITPLPTITEAVNEVSDNDAQNDVSEIVAEVTVTAAPVITPTPVPTGLVMTAEGKGLYDINPDYIGWLKIEDTVIDYPVVMEKAEDKTYYLKHWFDGSSNKNGTLYSLPQCEPGVGYAYNDYEDGIRPTTNILIFGHHQYSGKMFGTLYKYLEQDFYEKHKIISFNTAYEERTYEVVSVFRSHVFNQNESAFRYYYFFDAENEAKFNYWMENIKEKNEIKNDFDAQYGDEFLTLSTCHDTDETGKVCDNGRLAVVCKRIR